MILLERTEFSGLAAFHDEIRRVQQEAHGAQYTDNHDALTRYGKECPVQKELGVSQGGTLAALMLTNPQKLTGIDTDSGRFEPYRKYFEAYAEQHGIDFQFVNASSLEVTATACDLLHVDSRHTPDHLRQELNLHGPKVRRYIVLHDTHKIPALLTVIPASWRVIEQGTVNVGYTVLSR